MSRRKQPNAACDYCGRPIPPSREKYCSTRCGKIDNRIKLARRIAAADIASARFIGRTAIRPYNSGTQALRNSGT